MPCFDAPTPNKRLFTIIGAALIRSISSLLLLLLLLFSRTIITPKAVVVLLTETVTTATIAASAIKIDPTTSIGSRSSREDSSEDDTIMSGSLINFPPSPKALKVQKAIDEAIARNQPSTIVNLPTGAIHFQDSSLTIRNARNLIVRGGRGQHNDNTTTTTTTTTTATTTLLFRPGFGIHIENSSLCILESITIDYDPKPYVYGRVVENKKKKKTAINNKNNNNNKTKSTRSSSSLLIVQLDPSSLSFETLVTRYKPHDTWPPVVGYYKNTSEFKQFIGKWGEPPSFESYHPYHYYSDYDYDDNDYIAEEAAEDEESLGGDQVFVSRRQGRQQRQQQQQQQQQQQRRRRARDNNRYYLLGGDTENLQIDDIIVAATRVGYTMALSYTTNITLRNITIHSAGNMAITEFLGKGHNRYENISIVPSTTFTRTTPAAVVASNADGFHSSGMRYGPTLTNVRMNNLLDDYFNIHNTFQIVAVATTKAKTKTTTTTTTTEKKKKKKKDEPSPQQQQMELLVGDYQLFSSSSSNGGKDNNNHNNNNTLYGTQQTLSQIRPGELLSFYEINQLMFPQSIATGRVLKIERVHNVVMPPSDIKRLLNQTHSIASKMANKFPYPCSSCKPGLNTYTSAQLWRLTIVLLTKNNTTTNNNNNNVLQDHDDKNDDVNLTLSFLNADNLSNTDAVIDGCTFRGTVANLGRFKSSGGRIVRNTWWSSPSNKKNNNLEITPLQNWMEGMLGIQNVWIQDNVFHGVHENPIHTKGAVHVRQVNNTFLPSSVH